MLTFNSKELNTKYDYKTVKINRLCKPQEYGMSNKWYGGNCNKVLELKDEPLLVICNELNQTIDVGVLEENVSKLPIEMLKLLYKKYGGLGQASKNEMIEKLTA